YGVVFLQSFKPLIVITQYDIAAAFEAAAVLLQRSREYFQQCGFAAAIRTHYEDPFAPFGFKADIPEKLLAGETFGQIFDGQNIITAGYAALESYVYIPGQSRGGFDFFHPVDRLLPAFCGYNIPLPVPLALFFYK